MGRTAYNCDIKKNGKYNIYMQSQVKCLRYIRFIFNNVTIKNPHYFFCGIETHVIILPISC